MPLGMILKVSSSSGSTEDVDSTDVSSRASSTASSNQENSTKQAGSTKNWNNSKATPLGITLKSSPSSPQPIVNDKSLDDDSRVGSKNLTSPPRRRAPILVTTISAPSLDDDSRVGSKNLTSPPRRRAPFPVTTISALSLGDDSRAGSTSLTSPPRWRAPTPVMTISALSLDDDSRAGSTSLTSPPRKRAPTPVMTISALSLDDNSRAGSTSLTSPPRRRTDTPLVTSVSTFSSSDEWRAAAVPQFSDDNKTSEVFASTDLTSPSRRRTTSPLARIPTQIFSNSFSSEYHTPATSFHEEIPALYPKDLMSSPKRKASSPQQRIIHPSKGLTSPPTRRAISSRNTILTSHEGLTSPPRKKGSSAQPKNISHPGLTSPQRKRGGQDKIIPSKELTTPRRDRAGRQTTVLSDELTSPPRRRPASPKRQILSPKELTSPPRMRAESPRNTITPSTKLSSPPRQRASSPVRLINVSQKKHTTCSTRKDTSPFRPIVSSSSSSVAPDPSSQYESTVGCRSVIHASSPLNRVQSPLGTIARSDYPVYNSHTQTLYINSIDSTPALLPTGRNLKTASPSHHESSYSELSPSYDNMDIDSRASTPIFSNHASKFANNLKSTTLASLSNPRIQRLPKEGYHNRYDGTGKETTFFTDHCPQAPELISTLTNSMPPLESGELLKRSAEASQNKQSEETTPRSALFESAQWRAKQENARGSEWFSVSRSQSDPDNRAATKEVVIVKEQAVGNNTAAAAVREAIASSVKVSLLPRPQYRVQWADSIEEKFSQDGVHSLSGSSDEMNDVDRETSLSGNESEGDDYSASTYSSAEHSLPRNNYFGFLKDRAPNGKREEMSFTQIMVSSFQHYFCSKTTLFFHDLLQHT